MAKIKVTNPQARLINLAHAGQMVSIAPMQAVEVEHDAVVKKMIASGELEQVKEAKAAPLKKKTAKAAEASEKAETKSAPPNDGTGEAPPKK